MIYLLTSKINILYNQTKERGYNIKREGQVMNFKNRKLVIIKGVIISLCMIFLIVFVFSSPNSYLLERSINGDNKKGYTLYQKYTISNELEKINFVDHLPEGIDEFDKSKIRYGSVAHFIVMDQSAFCFYRLSTDYAVLVTKSNKDNDDNIEQYALISEDSYKKIASSSHCKEYEYLNYWN